MSELPPLWRRRGTTTLLVTHSLREAVRIADRVVVLSPRPARIVADIPVPLPHPRTDAMAHDPAFERLVDTVADALARSRRPAPEAGARP